jgi:RNA polymerase sigma-70 factor (ECF subfamily)
MLSSMSVLEDSSRLSVAADRAQGIAEEANRERRREFDHILSHALPRFRGIAMRWLRNPEDAEDAVQDAMLSAFRHIARFDGRAQMSTWLTAIVINAVRMQMRRRGHVSMFSLDQRPEEGQRAFSEALADPRPTPEENLERRELRELVNDLVFSLPASQQVVLKLRVRDDLSIEETAEALGAPEGTVKARLARGRAKLVEQFREATGPRKSAHLGPGWKVRRKASTCGSQDARRRDMASQPIAVAARQQECAGWIGA